MALDENEHEMLRTVKGMDRVAEADYKGSHIEGEPPRIWAQFEEGIEWVPLDFVDWMYDNDLVLMSAGINNEDVNSALVVELQDLHELV